MMTSPSGRGPLLPSGSQLKATIPLQLPEAPRMRKVHFRHPAYDISNNIMFNLYSFDHPNGGIHHQTALVACQIVADNAFDGYLSTGNKPTSPKISVEDEGVLMGIDYYFHVSHPTKPDELYKYPTIPDFHRWKFPHQCLPPLWKCLDRNLPSMQQQPKYCWVSEHGDGIEKAHLIPSARAETLALNQVGWFMNNDMFQYCKKEQDQDDKYNIVLL